MQVSIYGEGVKVPIYVERETIDFRTCVFGDPHPHPNPNPHPNQVWARLGRAEQDGRTP